MGGCVNASSLECSVRALLLLADDILPLPLANTKVHAVRFLPHMPRCSAQAAVPHATSILFSFFFNTSGFIHVHEPWSFSRLTQHSVRVSVREKKATHFPEISRKFEGLRLELVSRNLALVQQKPVPGPNFGLLV